MEDFFFTRQKELLLIPRFSRNLRHATSTESIALTERDLSGISSLCAVRRFRMALVSLIGFPNQRGP